MPAGRWRLTATPCRDPVAGGRRKLAPSGDTGRRLRRAVIPVAAATRVRRVWVASQFSRSQLVNMGSVCHLVSHAQTRCCVTHTPPKIVNTPNSIGSLESPGAARPLPARAHVLHRGPAPQLHPARQPRLRRRAGASAPRARLPVKVIAPAWSLVGIVSSIAIAGHGRRHVDWREFMSLLPGCSDRHPRGPLRLQGARHRAPRTRARRLHHRLRGVLVVALDAARGHQATRSKRNVLRPGAACSPASSAPCSAPWRPSSSRSTWTRGRWARTPSARPCPP